jgi:hypothetical protein
MKAGYLLLKLIETCRRSLAGFVRATRHEMTDECCSICGLPLAAFFDSYRGTGDGIAHSGCYWRQRAERLEVKLIELRVPLIRRLEEDEIPKKGDQK